MVAENAVTDGQTEPLLISTLACSLGFQALTSDAAHENRHFKYFTCSLRVVEENAVTDGQADGQTTLAAHARRGLMMVP